MKIIGFSQLHNELEKGNLHNWLRNMSEICDIIYIYDQASTDGSQEIYKDYNTVVIQSPINDFQNELFCKDTLLNKIKVEQPDTDWLFWMDGDTLLDGRLNRQIVESILTNNPNDGITLGHLNLWRSDVWIRNDNLFNYLHQTGVTPFWKFSQDLYFIKEAGLHSPNIQRPVGINKLVRIPFNLIHRGFCTDYQLITRYLNYKRTGVRGWILDFNINEDGLAVSKINKQFLPSWFIIKNETNPTELKKLTELYSKELFFEVEKFSFWELQHKNNNKYWLTGSDYNSIDQFHKIPNLFKKTVLELGVGQGLFTKELKDKLPDKLICVDISQQALTNISHLTSDTYLTTEIRNIPPVDYAICHLVFQHCNDDEVDRIISQIRLNKDGIFSFQFAFLYETPNDKVQGLINGGIHYFRTLEKIQEIITGSNKKLLSVSEPIYFSPISGKKVNNISTFYSDENIGWYIVKVCNK